MCIFSKSENYIFIHIPRTGGTSLSQVLKSQDKADFIEHTHYTHVQVRELFERNGDDWADFYRGAFKFTVIREPADRMRSLYAIILKDTSHHMHEVVKNMGADEFVDNVYKDKLNLGIKGCWMYTHSGVIEKKKENEIRILRYERLNEQIKIPSIASLLSGELPHELSSNSRSVVFSEESMVKIRHIFEKDYKLFY